MPRYPLILSHKTYIFLYREAGLQGKSLGKLLNQILDSYVKNLESAGNEPSRAVCIVCGKPATLQVHGKGQQTFFICPLHKEFAKKFNGYRELEI